MAAMEIVAPDAVDASDQLKSKEEDNRPWMTERQFQLTLERIKGGETTAYDQAEKAFKMKKEYSEQLKSAI